MSIREVIALISQMEADLEQICHPEPPELRSHKVTE